MLQAETSTADQPKVAIGIIAHNNEGTIEKIISSFSSTSSQIIVCDDASSDSTAKIAQTLNAQVIAHPHRLGPGAAMRSLFLAANQAHVDVLVTIPTDTVTDPSSILKLADSVAKHEAAIVVGSRFPLKQRDLAENYDKSLLTVYGLPVQDPGSPFRAYSKVAIATVISHSLEKADILPEAKRLSLGIMEHEISTRQLLQRSSNGAPAYTEGIGRLIDFTAITHPIEFYGGAAIIALIVAIAKTFLTFEAFAHGGGLPDFDVIVSVALFLVSIMLTVATTVLYVLSRNTINKT